MSSGEQFVNEIDDYAAKIFQKCEIAFSPNSNNSERQEASLFLQSVGERDARFLYILERVFTSTNKPEIIILFSNLGLKTISKFWGSLEVEYLLKFRSFIVEYLRDSDIKQKSVVNCVARLPCKISKLGWFQDDRFKNLTADIASFLSKETAVCNKGILFLSAYIDEIDKYQPKIVTARHRKICNNFRENELWNIFSLSLEVLRRILNEKSLEPVSSDGNSFVENALDLTQRCLNFDFLGTITDESSSEFNSLQIPTKWLSSFKPDSNKTHVIQVVWRIVHELTASNKVSPDYKSKCISKCLRLLNSFTMVRKSLFSESGLKLRYYSYICDGALEILNRFSFILNDLEVFNSFCRLLISFINNCSLNLMVKLPNYENFVDGVAKFTVKAFGLHNTSSNGIHFLLQLWSKFASAISFFRTKTPDFLKTFIPKITIEFLQTNLNHLCNQINEGGDFDSLLSEIEMTSIFEFLPSLFLFEYEKSVVWVKEKFDSHFNQLQAVTEGKIRPDGNSNRQLQIIEVEVSWLIYVIASVISGNMPIGVNKERFKQFDATLCAIPLKVVPFSTYRAELQIQTGLEATPLLERSLLCFFNGFQKSYIQMYLSRPSTSDWDQDESFFGLMSKAVGIKLDQSEMMTIVLKKLLGNLCYWSKHKEITAASLDNLKSISTGYESFKIAKQTEVIKQLLKNHFSEFSAFLDYPPNSKLRSLFFEIFTKFAVAANDEKEFEYFLQPSDKTLQWLSGQQDFNSTQNLRTAVGLCRDLRGVCRACYKRENYENFYDWFHGKHFSTFLMLFEVLSNTPEAAIPMLRFLEEFVLNRGNRIVIDSVSVDGLSLFSSAQKALSTYGARLSALRTDSMDSDNEIYQIKIKGITLTTTILTRLLIGSYVPFKAFEFYKDSSLQDIVSSVVNLIFTVPMETIYSYTKLAENYYELIESLFDKHVNLSANFSEEVFSKIVSSLCDGVQSVKMVHSIKAANALESLCSFVIANRKKLDNKEYVKKICALMEKQMETFLKATHALFQLIVFDSVSTQYTLTRALNALLVFNPRLLEFYAKVLVDSQPTESAAGMKAPLESLMASVSPGSLNGSQRDKFCRSLVSLKLYSASVSVVPVY